MSDNEVTRLYNLQCDFWLTHMIIVKLMKFLLPSYLSEIVRVIESCLCIYFNDNLNVKGDRQPVLST